MGIRPQLFVSRDADADWISALEIGRIDDGMPADRWEPVNCWFAWMLDAHGRRVGVRLEDAGRADLFDDAFEDLWSDEGPRFDAPTLGFVDVPMGAVLAAALERLEGRPSLNRHYFSLAIQADDLEAALAAWKLCLETGDLMAHYGLGYTHIALGNFADAFHHLSYYSTLATHDVWTWCWLGRAALGIGETVRAREALTRAIALESLNANGPETDAGDLLAGME